MTVDFKVQGTPYSLELPDGTAEDEIHQAVDAATTKILPTLPGTATTQTPTSTAAQYEGMPEGLREAAGKPPDTPEELMQAYPEATRILGPLAPPVASGLSWLENTGQYATERGVEAYRAGRRLAAGEPSPLDPNKYAGNLQTGLDVFQAFGAPLAAVTVPYAVPLGLAGAGAVKTAGGSEREAQGADILLNLGAGGWQGVTRTRAAAEAANIEPTAERLATSTPEAAGTGVQDVLPGAVRRATGASQARTYGAAEQAMEGFVGPPTPSFVGPPPGPGTTFDRLGNTLTDLESNQGGMMTARERQVVQNIQNMLTRPGGATPSYKDLDLQRQLLQKGTPGVTGVRDAIDTAMDEMARGTPAEGLRAQGATEYAGLKPARNLAREVMSTKLEKGDPYQAFKTVGGNFQNPTKLRLAQQYLEADHPDQWRDVLGAAWHDFFEKTKIGETVDPVKALKRWQTVDDGVKTILDPNGDVDQEIRRAAAWAQRGQVAGRKAEAFAKTATPAVVMGGLMTGRLPPGEALAAIFAPENMKIAGAVQKVMREGPIYGRGLLGGTLGAGAAAATPGFAPAPTTSTTTTTEPTTTSTSTTRPPTTTTSTMRPTTTSTTQPPQRVASSVAAQSGLAYDREINAVSKVAGVPPNLVRAVMEGESSGHPNALGEPVANQGGARAVGLMQIMPRTFQQYAPRVARATGRAVNINDPLDNLMAGAFHLRDDLDAAKGSMRGAAKRYNTGSALTMTPKAEDYADGVLRRYTKLEGR